MKTKKVNETKEALKALDVQISSACEEAAKILQDEVYGPESQEYTDAMANLKTLCEARAAMADSMPRKSKANVAPAAIGAGGMLLQTLLLLVYDEEHVVPKWFKGGIEIIKGCLNKD